MSSGAAVEFVEHVVVVDDAAAGANGNALTLEHVRQQGLADDRFDFDTSWRTVLPDDVLTLIYTSGTTGTPKGVEITHANLLAQASAVAQVLDLRFGDRITSYLPSAHIADRFTGLYALALFDVQVTVVHDIKRIAQALLDCRPTTWVAVPRIWNKLKQAVEHAVADESDETRRRTVEQAIATGTRRTRSIQARNGSTRPSGTPTKVAPWQSCGLPRPARSASPRARRDATRWTSSSPPSSRATCPRSPGSTSPPAFPSRWNEGHVTWPLVQQVPTTYGVWFPASRWNRRSLSSAV